MIKLYPSIFTLMFCLISGILFSQEVDDYVCLPCGLNCDKEVHHKPGRCSGCGMELVKKSTVVFKSLQPAELCHYIAQHPDVILLDVRTPKEFAGKSSPNYGTLKNAINIPIQEMDNRITELEKYKDKEIIVYCSHSQRSSRVSYMLTQEGFTHVINMAGGLSVLTDDSCKK